MESNPDPPETVIIDSSENDLDFDCNDAATNHESNTNMPLPTFGMSREDLELALLHENEMIINCTELNPRAAEILDAQARDNRLIIPQQIPVTLEERMRYAEEHVRPTLPDLPEELEEEEVPTNSQDDQVEPILLSAATANDIASLSQPVFVESLIYSPGIPEYPNTSVNGVGYCIPRNGIESNDFHEPWSSIQYNMMRISATRDSSTVFFGGIPCRRTTYKCTGGRACEFVSTTKWDHSEISEELMYSLQTIREELHSPSLFRKAISFARGFRIAFEKQKSCRAFLPSCELQLRESETHIGNITERHYWVRCCNAVPTLPGAISNHCTAYCDQSYKEHHSAIKDVLAGRQLHEYEECYFFDSNRRKRSTCDVDHIMRRGKIVKRSCNA